MVLWRRGFKCQTPLPNDAAMALPPAEAIAIPGPLQVEGSRQAERLRRYAAAYPTMSRCRQRAKSTTLGSKILSQDIATSVALRVNATRQERFSNFADMLRYCGR